MDGSAAMQLLVEGCSTPAGSEAAAQMLVSTARRRSGGGPPHCCCQRRLRRHCPAVSVCPCHLIHSLLSILLASIVERLHKRQAGSSQLGQLCGAQLAAGAVAGAGARVAQQVRWRGCSNDCPAAVPAAAGTASQ